MPFDEEELDEHAECRDEIARLDARLAALEAAFLHSHKAKYIDGKLSDECQWCGLDIRSSVHRRVDDRRRTSSLELALIYADANYSRDPATAKGKPG